MHNFILSKQSKAKTLSTVREFSSEWIYCEHRLPVLYWAGWGRPGIPENTFLRQGWRFGVTGGPCTLHRSSWLKCRPQSCCGVCAVSPTCFPLLHQGSWLWQPPQSQISFHLSWWGGSWAEGYEDLAPFSPLFLSVNGIIPALCCHHAPSTIRAAEARFFCALSLHTSPLLSPSETSPGLLVAACSTGES